MSRSGPLPGTLYRRTGSADGRGVKPAVGGLPELLSLSTQNPLLPPASRAAPPAPTLGPWTGGVHVCRVSNLRNDDVACHLITTLLPAGCEGRGVLGVGSIPVAILPSCQDLKTIALYLHKY